MKYEIEDKIFINDAGNQINYKRLVITGYLNGTLEKIELPINREQAVIYKAMQAQGYEVATSKGGAVDVTKKSQASNDDDWLSE